MSYTVELSDHAKQDVDDIYKWIFERSEDGAARWYLRFHAALNFLKTSDDIPGSIAPESHLFDVELRQLLFKTRRGNTYRAVFSIDGNSISVLAIRGTGEDLLTPGSTSD